MHSSKTWLRKDSVLFLELIINSMFILLQMWCAVLIVLKVTTWRRNNSKITTEYFYNRLPPQPLLHLIVLIIIGVKMMMKNHLICLPMSSINCKSLLNLTYPLNNLFNLVYLWECSLLPKNELAYKQCWSKFTYIWLIVGVFWRLCGIVSFIGQSLRLP